MAKITSTDFIPPIIGRVIRYITRMISSKPRYHPFDQVPKNIEAKLIIDIGANIGDISINALKSYPNCKVICFEPVKATYEILERRLEPYTERVKLYREALSSKNGESEINITNFHGANSIEAQSKLHSTFNPHIKELKKQNITLARLDDISVSFPNQIVDIMKIDVEGHEYEVLSGGRKFIQNNVDTIMIEASFMRDSSWEKQSFFEIYTLLSEMGFRLINVYGLNYDTNSDLMCIQMDCVFRHKSKMQTIKQ